MPDSPRAPCRVALTEDGPLLLEGPVEVTLPDGATMVSDRFVVALCMCRRSRMHPWCDTSHRRRVKDGGGTGEGGGGGG